MRVLPVVETTPVVDEYVTGIASIAAVGPCLRLTFYVEDQLPEVDDIPVRVVRVKLMIPREALVEMLAKTHDFLTVEQALGAELAWLTQRHH